MNRGIEMLRLLISAGADVNAVIGGGTETATPIIVALLRGYPEIVRLLISAGADVNAVGS